MKPIRQLAVLLLIAAVSGGCSFKRIAVNKIGNVLSSGGSTFETDDDPELVGQALPFGLKLMESLLAESPKHKGLLLATCSGFTEYAYVCVEQPADQLMTENLDRSKELRARARRLYLRARGYGMRGLEAGHPGFTEALEENPEAALKRIQKKDVPLLYWSAAASGLAIASSKDDPHMMAKLPTVEAMVRRVLELDEGWNGGAADAFLISIESARVGGKPEESQQRMKEYFERALQFSKGHNASLYVSYAEAASVQAQNVGEFKELLEKALAIDPDARPDERLANLIAQRRARWLLSQTDELFVDPPAK